MEFGKKNKAIPEAYEDDDDAILEGMPDESAHSVGDDGKPVNEDDALFDDGFNDNLYDSEGGFSTTPPMEKQYPDLLKGLTDFSVYLRTLYNNWTGLVWDEKRKEVVPNKDIDPIMNVKGANWCISYIETYVRKNNALSWLSNNEYESLFEDINRTLLFTLGPRYKDFGFSHNSDIIRVWNEVENASLLAISSAGSGKMMGFLGGREGGIMHYNATDQPMLSGQQGMYGQPMKKRGWFSRKINNFSDWARGVEEGGGR